MQHELHASRSCFSSERASHRCCTRLSTRSSPQPSPSPSSCYHAGSSASLQQGLGHSFRGEPGGKRQTAARGNVQKQKGVDVPIKHYFPKQDSELDLARGPRLLTPAPEHPSQTDVCGRFCSGLWAPSRVRADTGPTTNTSWRNRPGCKLRGAAPPNSSYGPQHLCKQAARSKRPEQGEAPSATSFGA